ncbi:MAG: EAL domain-containing protein [Microthrixaceae bacterium]|nr:EAL domain-containing protein [Microthrixaceae bacterium]
MGSYLREGILSLDPNDGVIIDLTKPAARLLGRPSKELIGTTIRTLLDPQMSSDGWRLLATRLRGGGPLTVASGFSQPGNASIPVELTFFLEDANVEGDSEGNPAGRKVIVISRDLSEVAQANTRTAQSNQVLNAALSSVEDGVAVVDLDGTIRHVNDSLEQLVDRPFDQLIGRSIFDAPWTWLDRTGTPIPTDSSPEVIAIRSGNSFAVEGLRLHGLGNRRSEGEIRSVNVKIEPISDQTGAPDSLVIVVTDRTEQLLIQEKLEELRSTDPLTGLMTRPRTVERLEELASGYGAIAEVTGEKPSRIGVLHVDLDDFRSINDTFGTGVGDFVLTELADRFNDLGFRHVEIGRIGVDEFLFITTGSGSSLQFDGKMRRLADELQRRIETPIQHLGVELRFTSSIGVSRFPLGTLDAHEILRTADAARRAARREGRNRIRLYDAMIDETIRSGLTLDRDLRRAAAQRELEVHYQPIIDLRTGALAAAEALVRWTHPERGPVPPSIFIPSAEATGAISSISDMVLTTVAADLSDWNSRGIMPADARISVNISAGEFEMRGFVQRLVATIENAGVLPDQLELELTESLLMRDMEATATRLRTLDDLGFFVALDDFGTGYSSLSYLQSLPLHTLKVDRRFVHDLGNGRSETITRAILSLAQGLGIDTVAEGVETDVQRDFLIREGCDMVQGFFYSPPMPKPTFERFLSRSVSG